MQGSPFASHILTQSGQSLPQRILIPNANAGFFYRLGSSYLA